MDNTNLLDTFDNDTVITAAMQKAASVFLAELRPVFVNLIREELKANPVQDSGINLDPIFSECRDLVRDELRSQDHRSFLASIMDEITEGRAFQRNLKDMVESYVSDMDLSDMVNDAVDNVDFDHWVSNAVDAIDFSEKISEELEHRLPKAIERAVENYFSGRLFKIEHAV